MTKRLAIICTHPIQYYAPVFQLLANQVQLKVFYTSGEQSSYNYDKGFDRTIEWDLPLLNGYDHIFLKNNAKSPGTHHFTGIVNPDLIKQVSNFEPNGILIYGWAWRGHLEAMRFFKGKVPIYFRGDSTLLNEKGLIKTLLRKIFLKWVYKNVDTAFYVGTNNKAYYKAFGLVEEQLIFAPHAIDNCRFGADETEEARKIRTNLKVGENDIIILFAGKLVPVKNPFLLLEAFIELDLTNVHLLFVGNGELEESLKSRVQGLKNTQILRQAQDDNVKNSIHFMDFQNQTQMPAVYQACDLFCLPSQSETWGLSVNEAMACGKAILTSDKVGCSIDLVDHQNGFIFKSEDKEDLKQKIIALTLDKTKLKKMGENSLEKIKKWSFEVQSHIISQYVNR
ncbi:glycosyltransferase family 4 protein [Pedobacter frigiditerrae]|uniref:glycosyltransferase family 4 protein n=1 Tax=Pedobacter frigiditerrae TaxID=2530452 RepID=UPI00292D84BC|nr:glycosyltransferase family 4 protein [Pedobacter frigiditerrae]